ncbi:hypothetical protein HZB08_01690 [Candidatus Saganbacteria bacterium]|uniref:NADH:quinone oxidoreductase/Mrp antiporter membrane subunit domain-containing protein n=1 Tax=Candidatus Saganbacteria bacterium TaxID=2575572 RepID=A0A9D6UN71_UNCSA|nr:hypothetical protein [Candidatus Saganbacteria bacterium]
MTGLALIGVIVTAAFFLMTIEKMLLGPLMPKYNRLEDADLREIFCLGVLLVMILIIGVYPLPLLKVMEKTVTAILSGLLPALGGV